MFCTRKHRVVYFLTAVPNVVALYGKVCDVRCRPIYLSPKFLIKKTPLQLKTAGEFSVLVLCFRRERTIPGFGNAFEKGSAVASIAHLRRWPLL